jgi:hypothetical protein
MAVEVDETGRDCKAGTVHRRAIPIEGKGPGFDDHASFHQHRSTERRIPGTIDYKAVFEE